MAAPVRLDPATIEPVSADIEQAFGSAVVAWTGAEQYVFTPNAALPVGAERPAVCSFTSVAEP